MRQPISPSDDSHEFVREVSSTIAGLQQLLHADVSQDAELSSRGIKALADAAVGLLLGIRMYVPPYLQPRLFEQLASLMDGLAAEAERKGFALDHDFLASRQVLQSSSPSQG